MKKLFAVAALTLASFTVGVFTPQWVATYQHYRDVNRIADDCNKAASDAQRRETDVLKMSETANRVFHECFRQSLDALVEMQESEGARKAGELARKL